MKNLSVIGFCLVLSATAAAQDMDTVAQKVWEVRGYLKDMQTVTYGKNPDSLVTGNLLHSRLNFRFSPSTRFTAAAEFRTRLFWGEEVRLTPNFGDALRNRNEAVNLQWKWFQTAGAVMHTTVDRLWVEYRGTKWEGRLGRQRINWGIATLWNPNDIFNTYNFLDFDYEERPGRDAARVTYRVSDFSHVEVSAAAAESGDKSVVSARYTVNHGGYDFQFSGGVYQQVFTTGLGWSGSIGEAGFKGEAQFFAAHQDTAAMLNLVVEADYMFSKGWYLNGGFLLNTAGFSDPIDNWGLYSFQLSPRNLMPTKYNAVITVMKEITPLFSANLSVIYAPGTNLAIILPSLRYNLGPNIDADVFWQGFYAEQQKSLDPVIYRGFIRFKWSF